MKKILVIDDDVQFNRMLCLMLAEAGYETSSAHNGDIGLKLFSQDRPDLVITDIYMPEKEGLETIMELRTTAGKIKILVMSGGVAQTNMTEMLNMAEMFGADAVLAKPFDFDTFLKTVRKLLEE